MGCAVPDPAALVGTGVGAGLDRGAGVSHGGSDCNAAGARGAAQGHARPCGRRPAGWTIGPVRLHVRRGGCAAGGPDRLGHAAA